MKVAIYTRSQELADPRFIALMDRLAAFDVYQMNTIEDVQPQTDLVLSIQWGRHLPFRIEAGGAIRHSDLGGQSRTARFPVRI